MRRPFLAGNWKMNGDLSEARALAHALKDAVGNYEAADVAVCPPFVALHAVVQILEGTRIAVGGQNLHWETAGAFTGEVSGPMLQAAGAQHVIVGHSERRKLFGESDEIVARKLGAALDCGLSPILCVGETLEQREQGVTADVIRRQVTAALGPVDREAALRVTLAYEPIWAIGTGRTATPEQAEDVHALIRGLLAERYDPQTAQAVRIQYGGSVKAANVVELMACPNVDGALVGGASLKADEFAKIVRFED